MPNLKKKRERRRSLKVIRKNQDRIFREVWNGSPTCYDAAHELGIKPRSASHRACMMRAAGFKLKFMPRGNNAK